MTIPLFLKQRPGEHRTFEPTRVKHSKDDTHGSGWAVGYTNDNSDSKGTICIIWDTYKTNSGRRWSDVNHDSIEPE